MDDQSSKKSRQPDAQADTATGTAVTDIPAAAAVPAEAIVAAPARPPARVRRGSAAVKSALSVIAQAPQPAPEPAETPAAAPAKTKVKLVRTSFSLTKEDHATLATLKEACRARGIDAKKSHLLRVAVDLLRSLDGARLEGMLAALPAARKRK